MLRIPGYFRNKLKFSSASQHADPFRIPPESSEENHAPNEPLTLPANAQQDPVNAYTPVTIAMNIECATLDTVINSTQPQEEKKQYLLDVLQGYVSMYYPLSTQQTILDAVSNAEPDELRHAILPLPGYLLEYMQQYGERDISPDFHAPLQDTVMLIEEDSTELPPAPKPDEKPPAEEPTVPHPSSFPTSSTRKDTAATKKKNGKKPKTLAQPQPPRKYFPYVPSAESSKSISAAFSTFQRPPTTLKDPAGPNQYNGYHHPDNGEWTLGVSYNGDKPVWEGVGWFLRNLASTLGQLNSKVFLVKKDDDLDSTLVEICIDSIANHKFLPTTEDEWKPYARVLTSSSNGGGKYIEFKVNTDYDLFLLRDPLNEYLHYDDPHTEAARGFRHSLTSTKTSLHFRTYKPTRMVPIAALPKFSFISHLPRVRNELAGIMPGLEDEATGETISGEALQRDASVFGCRIDLSWETLQSESFDGTLNEERMLMVYAEAPFQTDTAGSNWKKYIRQDTDEAETQLLTINSASCEFSKEDRPLTHDMDVISINRFDPATQIEKAIRLQREHVQQRRFFEIRGLVPLDRIHPLYIRHHVPNDQHWDVRQLLLLSEHVFIDANGQHVPSPIIRCEHNRATNWMNDYRTWIVEYYANDELLVLANIPQLQQLIEAWIDPWDLPEGIHLVPLGYTHIETTPPLPPPHNLPHQVQYHIDDNALTQIKRACIEACSSSVQNTTSVKAPQTSNLQEGTEVVANPVSVSSSLTDPSFQETLQDLVVRGLVKWANSVANEPLSHRLPAGRLLNTADINGACEQAVRNTLGPAMSKMELLTSNTAAYHQLLRGLETRMINQIGTMMSSVHDTDEDSIPPQHVQAGAIATLLMEEIKKVGTVMIVDSPPTDPAQTQSLLSNETFKSGMEEMTKALQCVEDVVSLTIPTISHAGEKFAPSAMGDLLYRIQQHLNESMERDVIVEQRFREVRAEIARDRDARLFKEHINWTTIIDMVNTVYRSMSHILSDSSLKEAINLNDESPIQQAYVKFSTAVQSMNAYHSDMLAEMDRELNQPKPNLHNDNTGETVTACTTAMSSGPTAASAHERTQPDPIGITPTKNEVSATPNNKTTFEPPTPHTPGLYIPQMRLGDQDITIPSNIFLEGIVPIQSLPAPSLTIHHLPPELDLFSATPLAGCPEGGEKLSIGRLLLLHTTNRNDGVVPWTFSGISKNEDGEFCLHAPSHDDLAFARAIVQINLRLWLKSDEVTVTLTDAKPSPTTTNPHLPPPGSDDESQAPQQLEHQFQQTQDSPTIKDSDSSVSTVTSQRLAQSTQPSSSSEDESTGRKTRSREGDVIDLVDDISNKKKLLRAAAERGSQSSGSD